jgi:PDZ domain-containing protein
MTQRTWAALLAVPLIFAGLVYAALTAMPFVTYAPGGTINVLGKHDGKPVITVEGHRTYPDKGQLRMTTVAVTERDAKLDLFTLMSTWILAHDDGIYPYAIQYPDTGGSQKQDAQEGQAEMIGSQDSAIAAALRELGYDVHPALEVQQVTHGMPADGKIEPGDVIVRFDGTRITGVTDLGKLVRGVPAGRSVPITVMRKGTPVTVHVAPVDKQGTRLIGVQLGLGYTFPFKVTVNIGDDIGGPSAGLMFALSVYDTLTPGSLTNGGEVAGTGTIDGNGRVGVIGGIEQKIAGARKAGAQLFLVPPGNCRDALTANPGSMRLAKATTLKSAISELKAWGADHAAPLPQCTTKAGS